MKTPRVVLAAAFALLVFGLTACEPPDDDCESLAQTFLTHSRPKPKSKSRSAVKPKATKHSSHHHYDDDDYECDDDD